MNSKLFVYGTLMSTAGHANGARLGAEARSLGPATIPGRLYRVGWYPGLVEATDGALVHGEVYELGDPAASLPWLDAYESIDPADIAGSEYERVERPVRLKSGETVTAWVYLYRRDVSGLELMPDGRWVAPST